MHGTAVLFAITTLLGSACSKPPVYGRPEPRDTIPNTKEKPSEKPQGSLPGEIQNEH